MKSRCTSRILNQGVAIWNLMSNYDVNRFSERLRECPHLLQGGRSRRAAERSQRCIISRHVIDNNQKPRLALESASPSLTSENACRQIHSRRATAICEYLLPPLPNKFLTSPSGNSDDSRTNLTGPYFLLNPTSRALFQVESSFHSARSGRSA